MSAVAEAWIDLLHHHGAHLLPLRKRVKEPVNRAWPDVRAMTRADALAWLGQCGNLGVNLGASGWIVIDTDNQLGTDALVAAGFTPDVVTANAQVVGGKKEGGRHFVFRAPTGVDPAALHSRTGIKLPAGGVVDVLAGRRFLVAPPTTLDEAGGLAYAAAEGGVFATGGELPEAPAWLTDPEAACPDELLPLRGMALGRGRADREYGADGGGVPRSRPRSMRSLGTTSSARTLASPTPGSSIPADARSGTGAAPTTPRAAPCTTAAAGGGASTPGPGR